MEQRQYLDFNGLSHYTEKIKQSTLYKKIYDFSSKDERDSRIHGSDLNYDADKKMLKCFGDFFIDIPINSDFDCLLYISDSSGSNIKYGSTVYSGNLNLIYVHATGVNQLSFIIEDAPLYIKKIVIEEKFTATPTKVSQLENDKKYVSSSVIGDTLVLNDE